MPSSFSRFLDEAELADMREEYLKALKELEAEAGGEDEPAESQRTENSGEER